MLCRFYSIIVAFSMQLYTRACDRGNSLCIVIISVTCSNQRTQPDARSSVPKLRTAVGLLCSTNMIRLPANDNNHFHDIDASGVALDCVGTGPVEQGGLPSTTRALRLPTVSSRGGRGEAIVGHIAEASPRGRGRGVF